MKIIYFEITPIDSSRYGAFFRMESLFDRWDMEAWLREMTPKAEVLTDNTSSNLRDNEVMVYCDAADASRIRLLV